MVNVNKNNTINYIELPMVKNAETKKFYHQAFEWSLQIGGPTTSVFLGQILMADLMGWEMHKYPIPVS